MPLLKKAIVEQLIERIGQLQPHSKASWGKMTVEEMLVHCEAGIQMGIGELHSKVRVSQFQSVIARIVYLYLLPLPKYTPAPPEINISKKLQQRYPFETARILLIQSIRKIETIQEDYPFPLHPIFRKLSYKQWGIITFKHLDHHLNQFGV